MPERDDSLAIKNKFCFRSYFLWFVGSARSFSFEGKYIPAIVRFLKPLNLCVKAVSLLRARFT